MTGAGSVAVVQSAERVLASAPVDAAVLIEGALERLTWAVADAVLIVPIAGVTVVASLLAWRGERVIAGTTVALCLFVIAFTGMWVPSVRSVVAALVVALLSWPLVATGRLGVEMIETRTGWGGMRPPVAVAFGLFTVPLTLALLAVGTDLSWTLASIGATVTFGVIAYSGERSVRWPPFGAHLLIAFSTVLLGGLLGWGVGVGADLARVLPSREASAALAGVVATGALGLGLAAMSDPFVARDNAPLGSLQLPSTMDRDVATPIGPQGKQSSWRN